MATQEGDKPATATSGPPSLDEWVTRELAKAPELTDEQIRNLCRIFGFRYEGSDPP